MRKIDDVAITVVVVLAALALVKYLNLVPILLTVGAMLFSPASPM